MYRAALNCLATLALERGVLRYRFRPKVHMISHVVYSSLPRNPRYMSCYQDEDFVFRTKRLAVKCSPHHVSRQVMLRYAVFVALLFSGLVKH